jgi:hypothetical protein
MKKKQKQTKGIGLLLMRKKKKKYESTGLTRQIRLTCQTWDSCHGSVITK